MLFLISELLSRKLKKKKRKKKQLSKISQISLIKMELKIKANPKKTKAKLVKFCPKRKKKNLNPNLNKLINQIPFQVLYSDRPKNLKKPHKLILCSRTRHKDRTNLVPNKNSLKVVNNPHKGLTCLVEPKITLLIKTWALLSNRLVISLVCNLNSQCHNL